MEIIEQCAWHESGRVVFAYLAGYTCDNIELSTVDAGAGKSRLQGGVDSPYIQTLLSGKLQGSLDADEAKTIEVAKKLIRIYCAGSCARVFQENHGQLNGDVEFDIPGQDLKYLEMLQHYLTGHVDNHPEDYVQVMVTQIFREIQKQEIWKPIVSLARQLLKTEGKAFTRFDIDDALMGGGMRPPRPQASSSYDFKVKEDDEKPEVKSAVDKTHDPSLDEALQKFLRMVRSEWTEEEMTVSVTYLKKLFAKHS